MTSRWSLTLLIVVVMAVAGTGLWLVVSARAEDGEVPTAEDTAQPPAVANPVVAVIAYQSETEYEPDPFEPDRLRRAKTEVKQLILVRADGTIEHKRAR